MSLKEYYIDQSLPAEIRRNSYEYFWNIPENWVETPNKRRGGWSGVIKHTLQTPEGKALIVYVKKQSHSIYRTCRYPLGQPTFRREFLEMMRAKSHHIDIPEILYYGQQNLDSILVTKSLEGYIDFYDGLNILSSENRRLMINLLGENLIKMRKANIDHGSLFPKHILVSIEEGRPVDLKLIDFEKSRKKIIQYPAIYKEVKRIFKHCPQLHQEEKSIILNFYTPFLSRFQMKRLKNKLNLG
jgi:tRNA A-37 threonylcarbamoyl transferase component Bud32